MGQELHKFAPMKVDTLCKLSDCKCKRVNQSPQETWNTKNMVSDNKSSKKVSEIMSKVSASLQEFSIVLASTSFLLTLSNTRRIKCGMRRPMNYWYCTWQRAATTANGMAGATTPFLRHPTCQFDLLTTCQRRPDAKITFKRRAELLKARGSRANLAPARRRSDGWTLMRTEWWSPRGWSSGPSAFPGRSEATGHGLQDLIRCKLKLH